MQTKTTQSERRGYYGWLEERVSRKEVSAAKEVQRLWHLSDVGAATAAELKQLDRAQKRLRSIASQLRVIRSIRSHRGRR